MPGLYKMESQKPSGVIVTSLTEGWTKFISNREHLFSPLENISIYADDDTIDLLDVMLMAYEKKETIPPADAKADNDTLKAYFEQILPIHLRLLLTNLKRKSPQLYHIFLPLITLGLLNHL